MGCLCLGWRATERSLRVGPCAALITPVDPLDNNFIWLYIEASLTVSERAFLVLTALVKTVDPHNYNGRIDACSEDLRRENSAETTQLQFLATSRLPHTGSTIMTVAVGYVGYDVYIL